MVADYGVWVVWKVLGPGTGYHGRLLEMVVARLNPRGNSVVEKDTCSYNSGCQTQQVPLAVLAMFAVLWAELQLMPATLGAWS